MRNPFKKVVEIHHEYNILPPFDWEQATSKSAKEYLRSLTRIQMLEVADRNIIPEHLWDEYYDVLSERSDWPKDEDITDALNRLYQPWGGKESIESQFKELQKQVFGMQKKLDKIGKIIEESEITMSGKAYLTL